MAAPVDEARGEYADAMNLELRQSIAAQVLEAMDVDQYLIDAVRNAKPPVAKPVVEEPTEFGSIVRAGYDEHTDRALWVRAGRGWFAETEHGFHSSFAGLHDPEVLRVGIGDESKDEWQRLDVANAQTEAYAKGVEDFRTAALQAIRARRANAITFERRDAHDNDITAIEGLQP